MPGFMVSCSGVGMVATGVGVVGVRLSAREALDAAVFGGGGGVEDEGWLIGAVEVELAGGEALHEDGVFGGGGHEFFLHGDFLIEEVEGGLVVVAIGFGGFEVIGRRG